MGKSEGADLAKHIKMHVSIMKYLIYWPPSYDRKIFNIAYKVYSFLMVTFFMVLFNIMEYVNLVMVSGDLDKMLAVSYLLVTNSTQLLQLVLYFYYSKDIQAMIDEMNDDVFQPKTEEDMVIIKKHIDGYTSVSKFYMGVTVGACILFGTFPIIDGKINQHELPFDYFYPYDTKQSPAYEMTFLYQTISMLYHGVTHVAQDSLYTGSMDFIGTQMDILANNLSKLENVNIMGIKITSPQVDQLMNNNLIVCVQKHRSVLK